MPLLLASCHVTREIYDDVYDQTEFNPTPLIDKNKGYADYIKKEEHKYTVEPEDDHYSYINIENVNSFNNGLMNFDNGLDYYCYFHNRFHTHQFDTRYCSDWPNNNFSYLNNHYNSFGNSYGCNPYTNNYGGFGCGNNYGYGNPFGGYWGGIGNVDPYSPWSVTFPNNQDSQEAYASSNHNYGHRNGTSKGITSNNTTVYVHTVKKLENEKNTPSTGLHFEKVESQSLASKNIAYNTKPSIKDTPKNETQNHQFPIQQTAINNSIPAPIQDERPISSNTQKPNETSKKPATNPFSKPLKSNNTARYKTETNNNTNGGHANSNSDYQNKYTGYTNTNTTVKTNNTVPSTSTSRRTSTDRATNSNKTIPRSTRPNTGTTSGHRGGGSGSSSSSSNSGSSRR